jgi:hypothetical protein
MGLTKPRAAQIYNLDYKQATRVVTTTNITLSGGAPSSVDSVSLSLGDRVLVTGQTTTNQNGLYYVTTVGSGADGTWARTGDGNETGEIEAGMIIMVTEGAVYHDTQWKLITDNPIIIGSTGLVFTQNYSANSIAGGTSNVTVFSNANVTISSAGTANVFVVSSTGTVTTGTQSVTGNITGGNVLTSGIISATGNVTGNYFLGNVFYANGITASKIYSGNSEVNVVSGGGNVNVSVGGTSNVAVFATTGEYVTGLISATGNISGNKLIVDSGNVTNPSITFLNDSNQDSGFYWASEGNIGVTVSGNSQAFFNINGMFISGNLTAGNIDTSTMLGTTISASGNVDSGNLNTGGNITGSYLLANIAFATGYTASKIYNGTSEANIGTSGGNANISIGGTSNVAVFATTGQYVTGVLSASGNITGGNITTAGTVTTGVINGSSASLSGNVTGGNILGNGAGLTGINVFSNISVTSGNSVVAESIADTLTLTAGSGIAIIADSTTDTITISTVANDSIFATGGDMGTVTEAVTASEDLGLVTDAATVDYDLGSVVSASGLIYPSLLVLPSYTSGTLPAANPAGQLVYLSSSAIGVMTAFSDGTNWRYTSTGGVVS